MAPMPPQWAEAMPGGVWGAPQSPASKHSPGVPPAGQAAAVELVALFGTLWAPAPQPRHRGAAHCSCHRGDGRSPAGRPGLAEERTGNWAPGSPGPRDAGCSASPGLPWPMRLCHIGPLCSRPRRWKSPGLTRLEGAGLPGRGHVEGDTGAALGGAALGGRQSTAGSSWAVSPPHIHTSV